MNTKIRVALLAVIVIAIIWFATLFTPKYALAERPVAWQRPPWIKFAPPLNADYSQRAALALPEGLSTDYAPPPDISHEFIVNEFRGLFRIGTRVTNVVVVYAGAYRSNPGQGFLYVHYDDPARFHPIIFVGPRGSGALRITQWQRIGSTFRIIVLTRAGLMGALVIPPPTPGGIQQVRLLRTGG